MKNILIKIAIKCGMGKILFRSFGNNISCGRNLYFKNTKYMSIGNNCSIGNNAVIECWNKYNELKFNPKIVIGDGVLINRNVHITSINSIKIGKECLLGSNIFISDHNHGSITYIENDICPYKRNLYSKGSVEIGEKTWIGENSIILSGVKIGKCSIVGAGSVVTKSFPDYSVIGGNPAKLIKRVNNE